MDFNSFPIGPSPRQTPPYTAPAQPVSPSSSAYASQPASYAASHASTGASHRSIHERPGNTHSALDVIALRHFIQELAFTDEGFNTPMVRLAAKIEKCDHSELAQRFATYHQELFEILTPETLRENLYYLSKYRSLLKLYRNSLLCSSFKLENGQGNEAKVDKLLACACSTAMQRALSENETLEFKELSRDIFNAVVGFMGTGVADFSYDHLIAAYEAARALGMDELRSICCAHLAERSLSDSLRKDELDLLWHLGETHQEGLLKVFCLRYISHSSSLPLPEGLQRFQESFLRMEQAIILHPTEVEITRLLPEVLSFCQTLGVNAIRINCEMVPDLISSLKSFEKVTLKAQKMAFVFQLLQGESSLKALTCPADQHLLPLLDALRTNATLKTLSLSTFLPTDEEEAALEAALFENTSLKELHGLAPDAVMQLKPRILRRPTVLRF